MSEISAAGGTSNQQHTPIPSKPDTGITDEDVEYWVGYNNGYTDAYTEGYMDGYSDAEAHYEDWVYTNEDNGPMSTNDDITPDVSERRQ